MQVDGGAWQPATLDARRSKLRLDPVVVDASRTSRPGAHTLVSRAIDATGTVQPTKAERDAEIASGREDNAQWTREESASTPDTR